MVETERTKRLSHVSDCVTVRKADVDAYIERAVADLMRYITAPDGTVYEVTDTVFWPAKCFKSGIARVEHFLRELPKEL